MKILITGNLGYIGPVVTNYLIKVLPDVKIYGFDTAYFAHSLTGVDYFPEKGLQMQYFGDIRDINEEILRGMDAIVHLAAISNDPIGNEFENVTANINHFASVRLVKMAIEAGVKNFVFASSCSMYGSADNGARKETDATNPLTAYAKSKIGTEEDVKKLVLNDMVFTSLRFATACGWSPRLRLDLVLNDFVACSVTSGEITVLSDGSPWRPLIDVEDMARAILWAILRKKENGGSFLAVNTGRNESNFQVKFIASTVAEMLPGTKVNIDPNALPDKRSYSVDFSLFKQLAPDFQPKIDLKESIQRIISGFTAMNFTEKRFRDSKLIRLNTIRQLLKSGFLDADLRWK